MYQGCRTQRWQNHWNRRRLHTGYFVLSYAIFTSSESSWVSFKSSSQTFLQCQMAVTLDKPGAAHMSKIISPGQGPNTCPTTTEGKFWRNSKCGRTPLREGQLYRGNLIWIATPLQTKKIWQQWAHAIFITFICVDISKQWNQKQVWKGTPYCIMVLGRMEVIIGALPKRGAYFDGNWLNRQTLCSCNIVY